MVLRPLRHFAVAFAVLVSISGAEAQTGRLTVEAIFNESGWSRFNGSPFADMRWAPSGGPWLDGDHYLWPSSEAAASTWLKVEASTGTSTPLFSTSQLEAALIDAGAPRAAAQTASRRRHSIFNSTRDRLAVVSAGQIYVYDIRSGTATRVTGSRGEKSEISFSPNGESLAFVKDNNLLVTSASAASERALTEDGGPALLNGKLDWVYSEELYGRGNYRGYWWSPDSTRIAFLQFDESPVPEYTLVDDIDYHPEVKRWDYPKAGDPNPIVKLGIVPVGGGPVRWVDTSGYSDFLIVNVGWAPDDSVVFQVQNRQQSWLELNRADPRTGAVTRILREESATWVERWQDESADPVWLDDGSFLWLSERDGWRHIYHYSSTGNLIRRVTKGAWEVHAVHGVDPRHSWIYFRSTQGGATSRHLHRVRLNGSDLEQVTSVAGRHRPFVNPTYTTFLDSWSDLTTPSQVRLHRTDGSVIRVIDANPVPALEEYALSRPELMQVHTRDGFVMEAMMIKPPDFDPSRRYPVFQFTYGGPHSPQVTNAWAGLQGMFYQLLAQQGIIVWICDNRTASGKGVQSAWPLYKNAGVTELRDIEDGLSWLRQQPYVDGSRVGISGWSYGGFMTLYALTHSRSFVMGIAGGAVTDWRNYDTIYTERYLGLPKENPEGYRQSSPRFDAASLHGQLLLVHGAADDNVHPQNAMQFAHELQRAGKQFRLMLYPKAAHGVTDVRQAAHLHQLMLDFTMENLLR